MVKGYREDMVFHEVIRAQAGLSCKGYDVTRV